MSLHTIRLSWSRGDAPFERNNYVRDHDVQFPGGQRLAASAAADYGGNPEHADPEQLLLSALSSCHMLTFIAVAANRAFVVEDYVDDAEAELGKDADGRTAVTAALLRPRVRFAAGKAPTADEFQQLHQRAHKACFIANSIRAAVRIEPQTDA